MQAHLETILRELRNAAETGETGEYLEFLDRVGLELRGITRAAKHAAFGTQFKPGDPAPAEPEEGDAPRQFTPNQKVRTDEGYIGHVAHYDRKGRVVVNVVWQACEYQEKQLIPIED